MNLKKEYQGIKKAIMYFLLSLLFGFIIGFFLPQEMSEELGEVFFGLKDFSIISMRNIGIILVIYLSMIFTKYYAYFTYALNGGVLGVLVSWILQTDLRLILLIVPHAIFEIPLFLYTSHLLEKGEFWIRKNIKIYFKTIAYHCLLTLLCALIEVYATPRIFNLFM